MGDRCYLTVEVHKDDRDKLVEFLEEPNVEEDAGDEWPHLLRMDWEEVNYGGSGDLERAANAGARFVARNDPGGSYGAGITVAHGGQIEACDACDNGPVCSVLMATGEPEPDSLSNTRKVIALMKKVYGNE